MINRQSGISTRPVVLLADDDEGDRELISRAFQTCGLACDLRIAVDGGQALDYLRRNGPFASAPRPDLVLLDLNMPRVSGHEVLAQVRADEKLRVIPIVVLTTSEHDQDVIASYNLGCNGYIKKPVEANQFVQTITDAVAYWFETVTLPTAVDGQM